MSDDTLTIPDSRNGKHGTYAGYNQHMRTGETPCEECRTAATDYQRQWRKGNRRDGQGARTTGRAYSRARGRAIQKLITTHAAEFGALLQRELS